jgi:hypothetical protein
MKKIDFKFNIYLTLVAVMGSAAVALFEEKSSVRVRLEEVFDLSPVVAFALLSLAVLAGLLQMFIFMKFWNYFFVDVFKVREISFAEAYALIMIFIPFSL